MKIRRILLLLLLLLFLLQFIQGVINAKEELEDMEYEEGDSHIIYKNENGTLIEARRRRSSTKKPTNTPTLPTLSPTIKPTTEKPTTDSPTIKPTTESPTIKPTTEKPTTDSPTIKPTTESPTIKPTTEKPTTDSPTIKPTTESPTIQPTTRKPTKKGKTNKPSTIAPTSPPNISLNRIYPLSTNLRLEWGIDKKGEIAFLKVTAKNHNGWIGFGVGKVPGQMIGSVVLIGLDPSMNENLPNVGLYILRSKTEIPNPEVTQQELETMYGIFDTNFYCLESDECVLEFYMRIESQNDEFSLFKTRENSRSLQQEQEHDKDLQLIFALGKLVFGSHTSYGSLSDQKFNIATESTSSVIPTNDDEGLTESSRIVLGISLIGFLIVAIFGCMYCVRYGLELRRQHASYFTHIERDKANASKIVEIAKANALAVSATTTMITSERKLKPRISKKDKFLEIIKEVDENPTTRINRSKVRQAVLEEFPDDVWSPSAEMLDDSILYSPENLPIPFDVGSWVERLGDDMIWHLEQIRRLVIEEEEGKEHSEKDYYYKLANGSLVHYDDVRASEEGLKRLFSLRPFAWQQYALLRLELYARFQKGHERDFAALDYHTIALEMWTSWVNDPRNKDFKIHFENRPKCAQEKLVHHLLYPMKMMNEVLRNEEKWPINDEEFSTYQYCSFYGSGFSLSLVILFLQIMIPLLLVYFQVRISSRFGNSEDGSSSDVQKGVFETDWDTFCIAPTPIDVFLMNLVVWIVYLIRVIPEVADAVYSTLGDKPTVSSRLNSLRSNIYEQGDDTFFMMLGFKLDRYMNAFYVALINTIMLFVLFLTESTVEIILNALAIEFVYNFDDEIGSSENYDPEKRYMKAAVIEMIFRSELKLDVLADSKRFCEEFDIDLDEYLSLVKGPMKDYSIARHDVKDLQYMSEVDKLWAVASEIARESGKTEAIKQYCEQGESFGIFDQIFNQCKQTKILKRYPEYYVWSRWENARFMSRIPENGAITVSEMLPTTILPFRPGRRRQDDLEKDDIIPLNFSQNSVLPSYTRFRYEFIKILLGHGMIRSIKTALRIKAPWQIPIRLVDGIFEWFTTWFIILFPLTFVLYGAFVFTCQQIGEV